MKILLDMNISPVWEMVLADHGHDAVHWSRVGDIRATDARIMEWARTNDYVVFTHDLDFSALLYATNARKPSVIQLRTENILPFESGPALLETLETVENELDKGALVTIDPRRHRIRILPFGNGENENSSSK